MIDSVENLAIVWASIDRLCSDLPAGQWDIPTGCPGWTVKDQLSHLVDYEARALGRPASGHEPGPLPHVKNEIGRANEVGVDARRVMSGAAVLDEFRQVTAERLAQLRRLTPDDLAAQTATPAGPATVADMLTLRLMDSWSHEQDIRRAVGRPGHTEGPAVEEAVAYFSRFLPYLRREAGRRPGRRQGGLPHRRTAAGRRQGGGGPRGARGRSWRCDRGPGSSGGNLRGPGRRAR